MLELVEGRTLAERIASGPLPIDEALGTSLQIAAALEAAHEKGIVHRDLKPANVKVTPDGTVRVLDFGLAKALEDEPPSGVTDASLSPTLTMAATRVGIILGTAACMSPEQAKGKPVDRRAHIWAFGVLLYEMLAGRQLFSGETAPETLAAVMMTVIDWSRLPAGTPPSVRRLLRRCLEGDPRRRLRDIGEARILIEDYLAGRAQAESVTAPAPSAPGSWAAGILMGEIRATCPQGASKPQEMEMIESALIGFRGDRSKPARAIGWTPDVALKTPCPREWTLTFRGNASVWKKAA